MVKTLLMEKKTYDEQWATSFCTLKLQILVSAKTRMPTSILDYPSILSVSHWLGRLEVDGSSPGTQFALLFNQLEKIKVGNLLYMSKSFMLNWDVAVLQLAQIRWMIFCHNCYMDVYSTITCWIFQVCCQIYI